jgi:hypothetical protein
VSGGSDDHGPGADRARHTRHRYRCPDLRPSKP